MGKKDDLVAEATKLGIELDSSETIADLEAKITAHKAELEAASQKDAGNNTSGALTRRKVNRGSTRRITRALQNFNKGVDEFIKELDLQVYMADEDGNRTGEAPMVKALREMKENLTNGVNEIISDK